MPIPEEIPIIAAAVLGHEGTIRWWLALAVCLLGVLSGDVVLYWVGRHWGELLNWRLVRLVLPPAREQWLKAAYRRHALKTVVTARHVMGLRAAAFLTAGIARAPVLIQALLPDATIPPPHTDDQNRRKRHEPGETEPALRPVHIGHDGFDQIREEPAEGHSQTV